MRFPAFHSRDFLLFTAGNFFGLNALWMNRVVIGWLGWELTGLASWVGFLSFLIFAPTIVGGPFLGVLLDRVDLRRAALLSQFVVIVIVGFLLFLLVTGLLNIGLLCIVALTIGVTSTADRTIRFVLVPCIVSKEALANAITIHGVNFNGARLIGPAIGGILIAAIGTTATVAINLAMVLPFVAVLLVINFSGLDAPKAKREPFLAEFVDGARYALGHPVIREGMLLMSIYSLTVRGLLDILPAIADGEYHRGAEGLGQMLSVAGAGALTASVFMVLRRSGGSHMGITLQPYVATSIGIVTTIALAMTHSWWVAIGLIFILGFVGTSSAIDLQTSVQLVMSDAYRGRVMSLWVVLVVGFGAINSIILGFFADILGMSETLVAASIIAAIALPIGIAYAMKWRKADALAR
jgi:MFS family permease